MNWIGGPAWSMQAGGGWVASAQAGLPVWHGVSLIRSLLVAHRPLRNLRDWSVFVGGRHSAQGAFPSNSPWVFAEKGQRVSGVHASCVMLSSSLGTALSSSPAPFDAEHRVREVPCGSRGPRVYDNRWALGSREHRSLGGFIPLIMLGIVHM